MTVSHEPKAAMQTVTSLPGSAARSDPQRAGAEVVARAQRRRFSNADKRRILEAADRCTKPGELGALMRREGVYSSSLSAWRGQLEAADLAALAPQKRGPKAEPQRPETLHIAQLTRERDKLQVRLNKALLVIDVQKNLQPCWATGWTATPSCRDHCHARSHPHAGRGRRLPGPGPATR